MYPQALRSSRVQTDLTIIHNPEKRVELPRGKSEKKTAFYTYICMYHSVLKNLLNNTKAKAFPDVLCMYYMYCSPFCDFYSTLHQL